MIASLRLVRVCNEPAWLGGVARKSKFECLWSIILMMLYWFAGKVAVTLAAEVVEGSVELKNCRRGSVRELIRRHFGPECAHLEVLEV